MSKDNNGFFKIKRIEEKEWEGMPEFIQESVEPYHSIKIHFKHEKAMKHFAKKMKQHITKKTKFIYYPKKDKKKLKDYIWVDTK